MSNNCIWRRACIVTVQIDMKATYSIVLSTIKIQHSIEKVVSLSFYKIQWVISISNEFIKIKQFRWKIKYKVGKKLNV